MPLVVSGILRWPDSRAQIWRLSFTNHVAANFAQPCRQDTGPLPQVCPSPRHLAAHLRCFRPVRRAAPTVSPLVQGAVASSNVRLLVLYPSWFWLACFLKTLLQYFDILFVLFSELAAPG